MRSYGVGNIAFPSGETKQIQDLSIEKHLNIDVKELDGEDVFPGQILWLPPREDLPEYAVRRAHGRGAIDEGIYDHPVVVISRPKEEPKAIHFYLITSLQGKRLNQLYDKSNEFHTSRRTWYLPVAPTPDHPDATSKKTKKRFPTLDLADGAVLRWDSYVNIRHVYKIDWRLLRPYSNPDIPNITSFRFRRESFVRLLSKGRILTTYEPGMQLFESAKSSAAVSGDKTTRGAAPETANLVDSGKPKFTTGATPSLYTIESGLPRSDFHRADFDIDRIADMRVKVPPDIENSPMTLPTPLEEIPDRCTPSVGDRKILSTREPVTVLDLKFVGASFAPIWMTVKGVTAVIIAPI